MQEYRRLLARVDDWYRSVKATCSIGCRDCCLGLFDISQADAELLQEGMANLDDATRRDIEARSLALLDRLGVRSLDGLNDDQIDEVCSRMGPVECPVLGPKGECRLYEFRPLTCRLMGAPVVDLSGEEIHPEGCPKCTLRPCDTPRIDHRGIREEEVRILRARYEDPGRTLLIPHALTARASPP